MRVTDNRRIRVSVDLRGIVQGVGFRPTLYRLATAAGLAGSVQNRSGSVRLVLVGPCDNIERFLASLPGKLPPHARIDEVVPIAPPHPIAEDETLESTFEIVESAGAEPQELSIPADLTICADCEREILDPTDRRYRYAFTTCTNCGPRYTVVNGMPYDRERTTMSIFPLCARCRLEYEDPMNRRFHAESTACPACGPHLTLEDANGLPIAGDPLVEARRRLAAGHILAVRGIGGYLLAADAANAEAIAELRRRKHRPHKPFALMADTLETVRALCKVPEAAERAICSPAAPIVIMDALPARPPTSPTIAFEHISPDTETLGIMLPTTPLHRLLLTPTGDDPTPAFRLLVMTSGNRGGEPICIDNAEGRERLNGIADSFLTHNRAINLRNDDSLCAIQGRELQVWRRARGYAPTPIHVCPALVRTVLAMGAELKNTIALGHAERVVLSPHIGDLETPEAMDGLDRVVACLPDFLKHRPEVVAVDPHPDMHATRLGHHYADTRGLPVIEVQHHYAHAVACLGEHGLDSGLALVLDGTGLGADGTIWGAELLDVNANGYTRLASFTAVPLPGGDEAVRRPARQLVARWHAAAIPPPAHRLRELGVSEREAATWKLQAARGLNAPLTHAAGRLFDAFSAELDLSPAHVTYEGQAAIRLEAAARRHHPADALPTVPWRSLQSGGLRLIDWSPAFEPPPGGRKSRGTVEAWAMAFHVAVAEACMNMVDYALQMTSHRVVALSGGVFMNRILTALTRERLAARGVTALIHRLTPPNDGSIALGQAIVAGRTV